VQVNCSTGMHLLQKAGDIASSRGYFPLATSYIYWSTCTLCHPNNQKCTATNIPGKLRWSLKYTNYSKLFSRRSLAGVAPAYLADDCRSTSNKLADRSVSTAGLRLRNDLPPRPRRPHLSFPVFGHHLKTFLFDAAFSDFRPFNALYKSSLCIYVCISCYRKQAIAIRRYLTCVQSMCHSQSLRSRLWSKGT